VLSRHSREAGTETLDETPPAEEDRALARIHSGSALALRRASSDCISQTTPHRGLCQVQGWVRACFGQEVAPITLSTEGVVLCRRGRLPKSPCGGSTQAGYLSPVAHRMVRFPCRGPRPSLFAHRPSAFLTLGRQTVLVILNVRTPCTTGRNTQGSAGACRASLLSPTPRPCSCATWPAPS
jgi:hypothetical protein